MFKGSEEEIAEQILEELARDDEGALTMENLQRCYNEITKHGFKPTEIHIGADVLQELIDLLPPGHAVQKGFNAVNFHVYGEPMKVIFDPNHPPGKLTMK